MRGLLDLCPDNRTIDLNGSKYFKEIAQKRLLLEFSIENSTLEVIIFGVSS